MKMINHVLYDDTGAIMALCRDSSVAADLMSTPKIVIKPEPTMSAVAALTEVARKIEEERSKVLSLIGRTEDELQTHYCSLVNAYDRALNIVRGRMGAGASTTSPTESVEANLTRRSHEVCGNHPIDGDELCQWLGYQGNLWPTDAKSFRFMFKKVREMMGAAK